VHALEVEPLKDALTFEKVNYMTHDWDNIPPVVPRFVIHLSKYIEGITDHVKHLKALETVESLRIDTTGKFEVRQPSFIPNRRFLCSRT